MPMRSPKGILFSLCNQHETRAHPANDRSSLGSPFLTLSFPAIVPESTVAGRERHPSEPKLRSDVKDAISAGRSHPSQHVRCGPEANSNFLGHPTVIFPTRPRVGSLERAVPTKVLLRPPARTVTGLHRNLRCLRLPRSHVRDANPAGPFSSLPLPAMTVGTRFLFTGQRPAP